MLRRADKDRQRRNTGILRRALNDVILCGTPPRILVWRTRFLPDLSISSVLAMRVEPIENFGVERYRLQDDGDCVGFEGCYWKDLDAQFRRAEFALGAALASHAKGEKLALVLDIDETTLSSYCEMNTGVVWVYLGHVQRLGGDAGGRGGDSGDASFVS